jgi:hypothetical protein
MHPSGTAFREIRQAAGPVLLAVFLLAGVAGPVAHLATHGDDHSHGTADRAHALDHDAAHRSGVPHDHPEVGRAPGAAAEPTERQDDYPAPAREHGRATLAHLDAALIEGPPPAEPPAPGGTLTLVHDPALRPAAAPSLPQPPSRGPPASVLHTSVL